MKEAEDAIERVMAGLRRVEVAPGLEGRVRDGVRRRMAARSAAGGRVRRYVFGWYGAAAGCAGLAVLLVTALSVLRVERRDAVARALASKEQAARGATGAGRTSVDQGVVSGEGVSQRFKPHPRQPVSGPAEAETSTQADALGLLRLKTSARGAVAEVVSFPAPPMPLTEQERLLLRVADHGGPEEVAMLDPGTRAMWDVEETAVFLDFFGRPVSVEQTNQKVNEGESR